MPQNPIGFSNRTFSFNKAVIEQRIIQAKLSSPEYRAEIRKIFQRANRRIQNVESKGLLSPAVMSLNKGDIKGFTKFSMKHDWEELKSEYAKAVAFLRQPTSTATGVREYNRHIMETYDLTEDEFNLMNAKIQNRILSIEDDNFVEQYLMNYKDFTGELEAEAADVADQMETDAIKLENALQAEVEQSANIASNAASQTIKDVTEILKKFGL